MPLFKDVHRVDVPLSNFAVQYTNKQLIATQAVPFVPVQKKTDAYYVYTKADNFTIPQTIRGPKDTANEVDWSTSSASYACIDHALRTFLPDATIANSDPGVNPRNRSVNLVMNLLLLAYERVISALVTTYANYGSTYRTQLAGGDQWDKYSTSDPLGVIETGREACFVPPNLAIMGPEVWIKLKHHPQILDRISGGATVINPALVTLAAFAELIEVDRVIVGRAKYNTANKAQTASYSNVWGKDLVLAYVEDQPSLEGVCAWKTFRWVQESTDALVQVRTYRDESKGGGGEYIECETSYDEVAVCSDVAYLVDAAVA